MQLLFEMGYPWEILQWLNRMRKFLQVLFLSDILMASGNKINPEVLSHQPLSKARSCLRWPTEFPTELDFQLWRDAMHSLCPSRRLHTWLGHFTALTHKIWRWTWDDASGFLCHASDDGTTEEIFVSGRKPNRFHYSHTRPSGINGTVCSVEPNHANGGWRLTSLALAAILTPTPQTFLDVLHSWGNTWLWDNILITGGFNWLHEAIRDGTLVAVLDRLYICKLYPNLCSAAFVIKCKKGRGWLIGSFSEALLVANAYRGELLGLMAIHLILLSIDRVHSNLLGSVEVVSDCLGALRWVTDLPPYRILLRCKHSGILKNILVHCWGLSFTTYYSHVKVHQDD